MLIRLLPALTAALAGCQGPEAQGHSGPAADAPLWAPGEEWRLSEDPSVTIGSLDGPEAIGTVGRLVDQSGVALLDDGRIAVADYQANEIRIYDGSGTRLITLGRTGDGPGEFRGVRGVEGFAGDSLLAWDSRAGFWVGRLSVFTAAGTFVRTIPTTTMQIGAVVGILDDGSLLLEPQQSTPPGWQRPGAGEYREPRLYRRITASGELLGEFGPVQGRESVAMGPTGQTLVYFGRDTYVTAGRRHIYTADTGGFDIAVHDPESGQVLRQVSRRYDPAPLTAEELSTYREAMRRANAMSDSLLTARGSAAVLEQLRRGRPDPDDIPARNTRQAFNRIIEDPDENLWVRHMVPSVDSVQTWSVFDREGSWLGEVNIPVQMSVRAIGRDEIAVVTRDEFGVEYVLLYRLLKY
jgi:hypothetical protein